MSKVDVKSFVRLRKKSKLFFSLAVVAGSFQQVSAACGVFVKEGDSTPIKEVSFRQQQLKGKVLDVSGKPIVGVSIAVKGTVKGTQTDIQGNFSIEAESGDVLVVSSVGYKSKEVIVTGVTVTIQLDDDQGQLDEVVVVGYGTQKLKEVTSSVAHVSADQFRQSGARNPLDLIQGKVAGLQVSRSGSNPNSGVATQLRGAISVTGSASPLFVIDGIPGGNPDLLQQDDIESIDVLKDGSGAAIYGTSANAGVILITTKRGKPGKSVFNYSSYFRKDFVYNRPDFLTAQEFRDKVTSGELKQTDFGHSTDFFGDLINKDNFSHNHNLSMSGGNESTTYRGSLNFRNLQGIAKENARKEYTLRTSINQKGFNDRLNLLLNIATNTNNANLLGGGGWESEATKNPTLSNFNGDGSYRYDRTSTNEFARLFTETSYRKQQTSSLDGKADLNIIEGLKASVFGSVQRNSYIDGSYRALNSEASLEDEDYPGGGYASKSNLLNERFAFEPTVQYNTTVAEKHTVTALAGYSYRYEKEEGQSADNRGFINDNFHEDNLSEGEALRDGRANMDSYKNDNTLIAFFGRINYTFSDKYMAQFILRREGSSKFGANNKWGSFPAVSVGWNISNEDFMKDVDFINNLKFRAGYGETGNTGFANNASRLTLGGGGKYLFPDEAYRETYGPDRNPNPNLRWETKKETNIGLDFTMFSNKLSGSIDLFQRKTVDLLDTYTTPQPPYIRNNIYSNVGTLSSKGIELALSYRAINRDDFKWNLDFTASTLKNVLDSYSNDIFTVEYKTFGAIGGAGALGDAFTTFQGHKIGEFFGKRFAGFDEEGKWLFYNRNGEAVHNDAINNSRDDLNASDLAILGNAVPKYYVSWTNNFTYKNFDLRIFMRGKFDYKILNTTALSYGNKVWSGNLLRDAFTKYKDINDTYMYSDYYLENGSHLKIDEVTLGYRFKLKSDTWVNNIRLYVTAQNLATITGYSGNDPDYVLDTGLGNEINGQRLGIDSRGPYPNTRSFLFGVNFGF
ncbi:SusC/RagA family TonB-linked outer membrane protein [Sphingobacterium thalpophilum]|uniref:SusC/RagA family TonB-linked outer membrane protein n=1 Tax=Sphingobacterium thalpophilum TaxID=259 RepID=UPI003DA1CB41